MARPKKSKESTGPKEPKIEYAPEVVSVMAARLIEKNHPHLTDARIHYLFRNGKWAKKGKPVFGQAKLSNEETRLVGEVDFVIIINSQIWHSLGEKQKQALLDHELTHCSCEINKEGNPKWKIIEHDFNDFHSVVREYGLWYDDLQALKSALVKGD